MARPIGPRKIYRYSEAFRATAVRLGQLSGATVGHVAQPRERRKLSARGSWAPPTGGGPCCESCSVRSRHPRSLSRVSRTLHRPRTCSR